MNYKYSIGQKIGIEIHSHPWLGDYTALATITGIENYVVNAVPVYKVIYDGQKEEVGGIVETHIIKAPNV